MHSIFFQPCSKTCHTVNHFQLHSKSKTKTHTYFLFSIYNTNVACTQACIWELHVFMCVCGEAARTSGFFPVSATELSFLVCFAHGIVLTTLSHTCIPKYWPTHRLKLMWFWLTAVEESQHKAVKTLPKTMLSTGGSKYGVSCFTVCERKRKQFVLVYVNQMSKLQCM